MSNTQPYTVMTVCTGNICRSPMGEIILRHFFNERGLGDQVNVESSGVSDEEWSHPIDPRAVRVLRERGYGDEIPRDHFAHRISREEIDRTDLFLPMTASHMRALLRMLPAGKRAEVHMYRSFDPNLPKPKIRSIWWTRGTAASTSSRSPSTRLRKSPRTSSIGWRSSCRNRPVADAVCFAVLRLRVSTSVTASRCRLPRQRKVQKITSLCKGGAEHSEAEGETNESGASEHQLHQQHIYNCAAGD